MNPIAHLHLRGIHVHPYLDDLLLQGEVSTRQSVNHTVPLLPQFPDQYGQKFLIFHSDIRASWHGDRHQMQLLISDLEQNAKGQIAGRTSHQKQVFSTSISGKTNESFNFQFRCSSVVPYTTILVSAQTISDENHAEGRCNNSHSTACQEIPPMVDQQRHPVSRGKKIALLRKLSCSWMPASWAGEQHSLIHRSRILKKPVCQSMSWSHVQYG